MKNLTIIIAIALMTGFMFADTTKTTKLDHSNCIIAGSTHCADTMDLTASEKKMLTSVMKKMSSCAECSVDHTDYDLLIEER